VLGKFTRRIRRTAVWISRDEMVDFWNRQFGGLSGIHVGGVNLLANLATLLLFLKTFTSGLSKRSSGCLGTLSRFGGALEAVEAGALPTVERTESSQGSQEDLFEGRW